VNRRGAIAFAGLVLYVFLVYANPGTLFFGGDDVGIAKVAAGLALAALGLAWLLRDLPLTIGGAAGGLLTAHFALVGASVAWSLWPSMSLATFADGLKYLAIFFLIANAARSTGRAVTFTHALAWASVIPAVGAISSWSRGEHLVEGTRAAWVGIFANPNDLAYHLDVGLGMALAAMALARRRWVKAAWLAAIGTMVAAILLTQTRGGLISAGVVLGLWALRGVGVGKRAWERSRAWVAVGAIVAIALWVGPDATWHRAQTTFAYQQDASAQGRIDAWRTGVNVMKARPITGVGAGAFPLAWAEFAPGDAGPARTAHNTYVQVIAETGVPSFLLSAGALAAALIGLGRAARVAKGAPDEAQRRAIVARAAQVGLGGFASCSLTGGHAYSWPLYFLLGLSAAVTGAPPFSGGSCRAATDRST
jgi:O-antigen ligase